MQPPRPDVPALVDRWVATGIISPDQASRIRADLASVTGSAARPVSLVAEGLGYLGAVIVVVGLGLVVGISWESLTAAARVGVAGAVWAVLTGAGALLPARRLGATGARLRGVLWTGATIAFAAGLGLTASELLHWRDGDHVTLLVGGGAAVMSAGTWAAGRHVLQHLSTAAAALMTAWSAATVLTDSDLWSGLAVWGVGVAWFVLSLLDILPRGSGGVVGAIGAAVGGLLLLTEDWGSVFALGTVVALVVVAVVRRQLAVLGVGSVGTLVVLPIAVDEYFPGVLPAAFALVIGGLANVAIAIAVSRRRRNTAS